MAFAIRNVDETVFPILLCDRCKLPIEKWTAGTVVLSNTSSGPVTAVTGIYHRGSCERPDSGQNSRKRVNVIGLDEYMDILERNHEKGIAQH